MTHRNAVLTPQGRLPAGDACPGRSSYRRCSRRGRYRPRRDVQVDRSLPPERSPGARGPLQRPASPPHLDQFQDCGPHRALTSHPQGSAPRISHELAVRGTMVSARTVTRWLDRAGLNRRRDTRPHWTDQPGQQTDPGSFPGPHDPPGRQEGRTHPTWGRLAGPRARYPQSQSLPPNEAKEPGLATPTCTPPSTASHVWPTPRPWTDEKASTTIGFFCRARAFFAAHGITRLVRVVTDNGANYRARTFTMTITSLASRHQRIRPYTPRHNGKVERYNRILAEECLYARSYSSEQQRRDAVAVWNHHYNYHRPHTACHS